MINLLEKRVLVFKLNSFCKVCFDPYKIVWNCKKHIEDKEWVYLCYNCNRYYRYVNGKKFKSQFQNVNSVIKCSLKPIKLELPFYELSRVPKDSKVY